VIPNNRNSFVWINDIVPIVSRIIPFTHACVAECAFQRGAIQGALIHIKRIMEGLIPEYPSSSYIRNEAWSHDGTVMTKSNSNAGYYLISIGY
jgi:hypothetical protein